MKIDPNKLHGNAYNSSKKKVISSDTMVHSSSIKLKDYMKMDLKELMKRHVEVASEYDLYYQDVMKRYRFPKDVSKKLQEMQNELDLSDRAIRAKVNKLLRG